MEDSKLAGPTALELAAIILLREVLPPTDTVEGVVRYVPVPVIPLVVVDGEDLEERPTTV